MRGFVTAGGTGRVLPAHLDTRGAEAVRGTNRVRAVDPNLIVGLDTRRGVHQVWGPSLSAGGWVPLMDVRDDLGVPYRGIVPWELVTAAILRGRAGGDQVADRIIRHNEDLVRRREAQQRAETGEKVRYCAHAVAREWSGDGRYSAEDMLAGLRQAESGGW